MSTYVALGCNQKTSTCALWSCNKNQAKTKLTPFFACPQHQGEKEPG